MSAFLSSIQLPIEGRFLRKLTKREWEILLLLAESFPDTEAADKSYITLKSYHNYKNRLCRKLGFKRAADLADFATKRKDQIELWAQWLMPDRSNIIRLDTQQQLNINGGFSAAPFTKNKLTLQIFDTSNFEVSKICSVN